MGRVVVHFGSAHLLVGGMPSSVARVLLEAAAVAGVRRFDTAPLYGHGACEDLVAEVVRAHLGIAVTTKVGLEPVAPPTAWRRAAAAVVRRLPAPVRSAVRASVHPPADLDRPSGRFAPEAVRRSIERSLSRLGRIDRLLLHEVHPADITESLLDMLRRYRQQGDIAALGVATANVATLPALARSRGLFAIAHLDIDPLGPPLGGPLPDGVQGVGHGALGAGGRTLGAWRAAVAGDTSLARRWAEAVRGTAFEGEPGHGRALLARAASVGPGELVVATRQPSRVGPSVRAASGAEPLPSSARALLDAWLASAHAAAGRSPGVARAALR